MIRALIVDDEPPSRRKIRRFLERDAEIGGVREAGSTAEAVAAIREFAPELVYLDVEMPDGDGFSVLAAAPEPRPFHVVFLTAHDRYAVRAFDEQALDYLMKPVSPERFERSLERAKEQVALTRGPRPGAEPRRTKRLVVQKGARELLIPVDRIDWADADRNYVCLHAGTETFTIRGTLESLARRLDPDEFVRINRSQLVNLDRIREMQPWFHGERRIILKDGRELAWTRRFRTASETFHAPPASSSRR